MNQETRMSWYKALVATTKMVGSKNTVHPSMQRRRYTDWEFDCWLVKMEGPGRTE